MIQFARRPALLAAWLGLLLSVCCHGAAAAPVDARFEGQRLHLLNWSDYLDPGVAAAFERHYGVKLVHTYYETDEHRDRLLAENGIQGYDLAVVDSARLPLYRKRGWIRPFDRSLMPGLGKPVARCRAAAGASADYSVPYFWGTEGIAYRSDLVEEPLTRWMQLYRPAESLRGKIVMIDDAREVLGMAALALGYDLSTDDLDAWTAAARLAASQRPFLHSYGTLALDESSAILSGEVVAAQIYNGEAVALRQLDDRIRFAHPEEGSVIWVDHWVLLAESPHPELAHAFLNFINEPRRAVDNAQSVYFATCNAAAETLLPKAFREDPVIYPPDAVMRRLEVYKSLSPRALRQINMDYSRIQSRD